MPLHFAHLTVLYIFLYGRSQIPIRTMFPEFYAIYRWSPKNHKICVLLYFQHEMMYQIHEADDSQ